MIGNLLERATQDLRALKMSKRADRPPLTAASSDPSPAVGYGIPVAMPTYHYLSGHSATRNKMRKALAWHLENCDVFS